MKLTKFFALFGLFLGPIVALAAPIESETLPETSPNPNVTGFDLENPAIGGTQKWGLNCRGWPECRRCHGFYGDDGLWAIVQQIPDGRYYRNNELAACNNKECEGGICVFAQHHEGKFVTGATIKEKVKRLMEHKCKDCGSCPIYAGNNGGAGEITVNYRNVPCAHGVCP